MVRAQYVVVPELTLEKLAAYHQDVLASFRVYFSPTAPGFEGRFVGQTRAEVAARLQARVLESDARSALMVLTGLEAHFRTDFYVRCRRRTKDDLSRHFRAIERRRGEQVRLDEDILEGWKRHAGASATLISQLRSAFRYRHWLAHGRYWRPKLGHKYDFDGVYFMASAIISAFKFLS